MIRVFLLILSVCFMSVTVQAMDKHNPFATQVIWAEDNLSGLNPMRLMKPPQPLFSEHVYNIHFIRPEGRGHEAAILRMSQPVMANGCMDIMMLNPIIQVIGNMLQIEVRGPAVLLERKEQYGHHDCANKVDTPHLDIGLTRSFLKENAIDTIALRNAAGVNNFDVLMGDYNLILQPRQNSLFQPSDSVIGKNPLEHWFYPKNTVVLNVPRSKDPKAVLAALEGFAEENGLEPLMLKADGFISNESREQDFLFCDVKGTILEKLEDHKPSLVGVVEMEKPVFSGGEINSSLKKLDVFATLPTSNL